MPLPKGTPASKWIHDFVHSNNPRFKGKSKKKRIQMALAAKYANEETEITEGNKENKAKKNDTVASVGTGERLTKLAGFNARHLAKYTYGKMRRDGFNPDKIMYDVDKKLGRKKLKAEETDMTQVNEYKYGSTHEFRGGQAFMDKHAEKILKKHDVQIHSVELLPDEKEVIFHVSGSVDGINKASQALYDAANGGKPLVATKYTPPKFFGMTKKHMQEETQIEEQEMTRDDILSEGPHAILAGIVDENPEVENAFNTVMGAKIDAILDGLRNELAAGMFEVTEKETTEEVAAEEVEEEGKVIEEEQINEVSDETKKSYRAALPMSIAKNATNSAEAGRIGRSDLASRYAHKALKRVGKATELLARVPKDKKPKVEEPAPKAKKGKK